VQVKRNFKFRLLSVRCSHHELGGVPPRHIEIPPKCAVTVLCSLGLSHLEIQPHSHAKDCDIGGMHVIFVETPEEEFEWWQVWWSWWPRCRSPTPYKLPGSCSSTNFLTSKWQWGGAPSCWKCKWGVWVRRAGSGTFCREGTIHLTLGSEQNTFTFGESSTNSRLA
jgi:hypothetical protein